MSSSSTETLTEIPRAGQLGIHRGAIDQSTITTSPPSLVMKKVKGVLQNIGIEIEEESEYKYRCIRPRKDSSSCEKVLYGESIAEDPADEVRFSVELTRLDRLKDTYSLDIRRLKGNLRSYGFLYSAIRE
ncbi:hypothetical protein BDQ17DRAFT_255212 [Cyathus striatus]|nr:hypothetical protein BDQ17DRAFT_255212 [Cyathus striatus]